MHQLELHHPFGTSSLRMVGRPDPVVGSGEVLVRMRAI
jgi:NADPH:quinone reductase-like Zn-dependent oxidoreductase